MNTLGTFPTGDALTTTPDRLRLMIDINLGSALWLSRQSRRTCRSAPNHRAHRVPTRYRTVRRHGDYAARKAALVHLTRILDVELRPLGIRVNTVAPHSSIPSRDGPSFPKKVIGARRAPEAIADVVVFLVSDAAAPMSGAILPAYGA